MAFPREAFRDLISHLVDGVSTTWTQAPLGYQAGARIILRATSSNEIGYVDDKAETYNEITKVRAVSSIARRLVRVSVRVDSFDPTVSALDVAEKIRTRMYRETSRVTLDAMGLSYLGSESLVTATWPVDGREGESAILSIRLYHLTLDAQTDNEGGVIDTADVSGSATT